jgi:flagellar biosynthesis protein FliR
MDLSPLIGWYEYLPLAILVFARVAALFAVGPIIGDSYIPTPVKGLLALAVSGILFPIAAKTQPVPVVDLWFVVLLAKETLVGLSMGFFVSLFFNAVRFGGELINRYSGFAAAENFDPDTNASVTPVGDVYHMLIVLLFLAVNGHHYFFAALARSYDLVPIGGYQITGRFQAALAQGLDEMSIIAVAMSFPVLAAVMAITAAEGVITRAVPQINIMHVSFAVKIVVSLMVMYAGLPSAVVFLGTVLGTMQTAGYAMISTLG